MERVLSFRLGPILLAALAFSSPAVGAVDAGVPARAPAATVTYSGEPVFVITETVFGATPARRVTDIETRLARALGSPLFRIQDVLLEDHDPLTMAVWGDELLFAVTDEDARAARQPRRELAADHVRALGEAMERARAARAPKRLVVDAAYALLATAALVLAILGLNALGRRLRSRLERWVRLASGKLHDQSTTDRLWGVTRAILRLVYIAVILALLYSYLPLVLGLFPWTGGWSATLLVWALDPVKRLGRALVDYLPNVFVIGVAVVFAWIVLRVLRAVFTEIGAGRMSLPGFYSEWARPTFQLLRVLVVVFAGVIIFPYLPGAESPAFRGVSILLGILVTFSSGTALANLFAGILLTYTRAFRLGDRVRVGDTYGDVVEQSLLVTRLRTIKNEEVAVPNAVVLGAHIINYSAVARQQGLILHTQVTIGYDAPWRQVHGLLLQAARATPRILATPAPFVWQKSLNDFYVTYELNAYTDHPEVLDDTYAQLHQGIRDAFDAAGVEIMSPHYASLRDGSGSTVVPPERRGPA